MDLSAYRKEYSKFGLRRKDLHPDPMKQFADWFEQAVAMKDFEANAMTLATVDAAGRPSQRIVLLKRFDAGGFTFFTNYGSVKAREIEGNPAVSLLFPWITMERQVIIQGRAEKTTADESLGYFRSRPRESQLGAWVSNQSEVIASRSVLTTKLEELTARFGEGEIPLPPDWGGFRVVPEAIEFWQGGAARIHDRFIYRKEGSSWMVDRLSP